MPSLSHIRHVSVAALVVVGLLLGSVVVATSAGADPSASEHELAGMVNDYRARNGLPPLRVSVGMSSDARAWSAHMAATGLAHDANFTRSCDRFPGYTKCGENVGYASNGLAAVQSALEASATHRANLLCACTHLGVGVVDSGGRTWVTQRFVHEGQTTAPAPEPAPAPAPAIQFSQAQVDGAKGFVRAVYADFLHRSPSASDLDHWAPKAVTSGQRLAFVHALAYSPESLGAIVDGYYQDALDRPADAGGKRYWVDKLRSGLAPADLAVRLYASEEHFAAVKQDLRRWVDDVYVEVLGRRADDAGRAHWASVAQRDGRRSVARSLQDSTESLRRRVGDAYQELLGRAVDPTGLSHWTAVLRWTRNDVHLTEALASSVEYHQRALRRF